LSSEFSRLTVTFVAGAYALLSPCGYPMLPGYISYYLGIKSSLRKAVTHGVACVLGIITVFSTIGAIASLLGSVINPLIPYLELVAGIATILFGISILIEIDFSPLNLLLKAPKTRGAVGIFLYGVIYGLATLGCSAPLFFSILFLAIASGSLNGFITFLVYALGMSVPLILTTVLVVMAKKSILKKIVTMTSRLQKMSGIILLIIGTYLIYYYYTVSMVV
jgi:cytochrome c-type biogenesis protein